MRRPSTSDSKWKKCVGSTLGRFEGIGRNCVSLAIRYKGSHKRREGRSIAPKLCKKNGLTLSVIRPVRERTTGGVVPFSLPYPLPTRD